MTSLLSLESLPALGIGLNFQKSYCPLLKNYRQYIDFVEFNPDSLCQWTSCQSTMQNQEWVLELNTEQLEQLKAACSGFPLVAHGLSLSIGSASGWNHSYPKLLGDVSSQIGFPWHSEHLGFLDLITPEGQYLHAGTQLPMPFTEAALELLIPRINTMIEQFNKPFLMENTTYYFDGIASDDMDEIDFLNQLCERSDKGFGLLFDLYNFYCNAINFGFDPYQKLEKLNLDYVVELHLAGGTDYKEFMLDVHSNTTPEPVWEMLSWLLQRAPNVKGVVFELLEQALDNVAEIGILRNLERAQSYWKDTASVRCVHSKEVCYELA